MVSLTALARQLARNARAAGRERFFAQEMAHPDMAAAVSALSDLVRRGPNREHLVVATPRGGERRLAQLSGDADSVPLPVRGLDGGETARFVHNHPLLRDTQTGETVEFPLSAPDLGVGQLYEGMYGSRGFGRMAQVSSVGPVTRPRYGSVAAPTRRSRRAPSERLSNAMLSLLQDEISRARLTGEGMSQAMSAEAANRALARLGLIRYGSRFSGETAEAMRLRDPEIMAREDELVRALHPRIYNMPYPLRPEHLIAGAGSAIGGGTAVAANALGERRPRKRQRR